MKLIDADKLIEMFEGCKYEGEFLDGKLAYFNKGITKASIAVKIATIVDAAPVVHGRWIFTPHSYYRDEDYPDGIVYVMAHCSECEYNHPDRAQVYRKVINRPDEYDCVEGWIFDKELEETAAVREAEKRRGSLSPYCPNCGAKMDR